MVWKENKENGRKLEYKLAAAADRLGFGRKWRRKEIEMDERRPIRIF